MKTVTIGLRDDVTGDEDGTVATRRFGFDGADYEIDLTDQNWAALSVILEPFVTVARKAGRKPRSRSKAVRAASADIRNWAKSEGLSVSDNGRLPGSVKERYEAAHAA